MCLCYWYGPLVKGLFNNTEVGVIEGEPIPPLILLKEALKARVAAYKKAIENAVKAVVVIVKNTLAKPSELIKVDLDSENNSNNDAYAAFKDINNIKAIRVEDKGDSILD